MIRDDQIGLLFNGGLVDFFGVVGEDGTGTDHEFQNGRAARLPGIVAPSALWNRAEWLIINNNPSNANSDATEEVCAPGFFGVLSQNCSSEFDPLEWAGQDSLPACAAAPPPPPPPPPPVCSGLCGDIDSNGEVTVTDVIILTGFVLGYNTDPCVQVVGDVSPDNLINVSDTVVLIKLITENSAIPTDCSIFA